MRPDDRRSLDPRRAADFHAELLARRAAFLAAWTPGESGPDAALLWIVSRYLEAIATRLDRAPEKNRLAFFDLLGIDLVAAQEARLPLVFTLGDAAADVTLPAGTQVAAPPPPGSSQQVVFETEEAAGLAAAHLKSVVSLWPGRDQAIDHGADFAAGRPITPWDPAALADTPHVLYVAHDTVLAFSGQTRLSVEIELATPSSAALEVVWEYWDGAVWRGFAGMRRLCGEAEASADGTGGFTASGRILLAADCAETAQTTVGGIASFWIRGRLDEPLPIDPARVLPQIAELKLAVSTAVPVLPEGAEAPVLKVAAPAPGEAPPPTRGPAPPPGLLPDKALSGAEVLDTSKSFYPLGQSPKPGDAFYLASAEVFGKPGAVVTVRLTRAATPADEVAIDGSSGLDHELAWEYFDGAAWRALPIDEIRPADSLSSGSAFTLTDGGALLDDAASGGSSSPAPPADLAGSGSFSFRVPDDLSPVEVHGEKALWVRARLVSGGYGIHATVTFTGGNSFSYVLPRPPALAELRLGYSWEQGPYVPAHVLAYNDFAYLDWSEAARWPGHPFAPFATVTGQTPALYLGFDRKLPVDSLNLFLDVVEARGDTVGPDLVWESWDGIAWDRLPVEDGTSRLRVPGMVSLIGPEDAAASARFGDASLYWLRARLKEDGPPGAPTIAGIYPNAVWASQRQTIASETLGRALGSPSQVLTFRQFPVLAGEQVEVQELSGARADVEWRLLAQELFGARPDAAQILADLEARLAAEGRDTDVTTDPLHLVRDRTKRVTEAWVRWEPRPTLLASGPADRCYALDRTRGRLLFGDGEHGRVPPAGASVVARRYQTGGGSQGNVAPGAAKQLLAGVPGVQGVSNPKPGEGGADGETLSALGTRAPATLRRRGRAVTADDFAALARETSPAVAAAWALPTFDADGRRRPGWATLVVIPASTEPQPWPSFGLREQIRAALAEEASAQASAALHLYVTGPDYLPVDVAATVAVADLSAAGTVDQAARAALATFLHPLAGGPEGEGWAPGRGVYLSDLATALARVPGVDHVEELALLLAGQLQGEQIAVPAGRVVAAGALKVQVV